ncbi:hypothetical protein IWZ01DRAFT_487148 [Phyllosticta capitalensis]
MVPSTGALPPRRSPTPASPDIIISLTSEKPPIQRANNVKKDFNDFRYTRPLANYSPMPRFPNPAPYDLPRPAGHPAPEPTNTAASQSGLAPLRSRDMVRKLALAVLNIPRRSSRTTSRALLPQSSQLLLHLSAAFATSRTRASTPFQLLRHGTKACTMACWDRSSTSSTTCAFGTIPSSTDTRRISKDTAPYDDAPAAEWPRSKPAPAQESRHPTAFQRPKNAFKDAFKGTAPPVQPVLHLDLSCNSRLTLLPQTPAPPKRRLRRVTYKDLDAFPAPPA